MTEYVGRFRRFTRPWGFCTQEVWFGLDLEVLVTIWQPGKGDIGRITRREIRIFSVLGEGHEAARGRGKSGCVQAAGGDTGNQRLCTPELSHRRTL
jgi:hypothetical protein